MDLGERNKALQDCRHSHLTSSLSPPFLSLPVHIMDPGCLYYGVQPVGAPGPVDRREGRGVCQDRAEQR